MIEQTPVLPGLPPSGGPLTQTPLVVPHDHRATPRGLGGLLSEGFFELSEEQLDEAAVASVHGGEPDDAWDEFTVDMMRASCAFFAQEVLTGPPEHPYNGRFMISDHHQEWDELIAGHDRLCVLAPRDHGKCQRGDALILTPSGKRIRIDEWLGGDLWAYDTDTHKFVSTYAPASRPNGVKRVLRVTTQSGRRVEVTENHPLRLWNRWCRADELQVGERIGVPYVTPSMATGSVPDAWLIGLLVGDGGLTGSNVVLSTGDNLVLEEVKKHYDVRPADRTEYRLLGLRPRMRELGLAGHTSHTKRVPEVIFEARNEDVAEFISGYLDADAHVNSLGGGSVEFYSVNEELLRDVQHLLTRLGVLSVLTPKRGKYKGETHHSWGLTIRGKDLVTLSGWVHPRGQRQETLREVVVTQGGKAETSGDCLDRFPEDVWDLVEHSEDWFRRNEHTRPTRGYEPTREKVRRVARAENNQELLALTEACVLWDEIVSIEDLGEDETWSIHVPEHVNYLADDIINHNTFFFDFAYPIWKAYFNPRTKGFIFSATQPQAERILDDVKAELESNPRLQWLVPDRPEMWTKKEIRLTNGVTIYARSFGTKVRGAHPHWIVVDDGLTDETAYSELVRKKQIDYFYTAITNMVVPGGQIIVVGTPFHMADLYADLRKNAEYEFRQYQAYDEKNGIALWPERYDVMALLKRKREIGPIRFNREFQCVPIADEMSLFPGYLFKGDPTEQYLVTLGMPWEFWKDKLLYTVLGGDFAISAEQGADYSVFFVLGVDVFGNRWVLDISRSKGKPYHEQLSEMNRLARKYQCGLVLLESNQMQAIFGQELKRKTDLPVKEFVTGVQKHALDKGVPSLRILLENQKWRIPRGDARSIEETDIWIAEMRSCTIINGKVECVGEHDDTIMACWIADQAIRLGTFSYTFGDESDLLTAGQLRSSLGIPEDPSIPEEIADEVEKQAQAGSLKLTPAQRIRLGLDPGPPAGDVGLTSGGASGNLVDDEFTGLFG